MAERKRIRIVSDGGVLAEITDADTGARIPGITAVAIAMRAGDEPRVTLETRIASIDVIALTDASVADDEAFVARLDAVLNALRPLADYAWQRYPREISGPLQDAATSALDALTNVTPLADRNAG